MGRPKFVFRQKIIRISQSQQYLLDEIMATGAFAVESEVFRQGLILIHKRVTTPEYLKPSINEERKMEEKRKDQAFRAIPDEEFVEKNVPDTLLFTDDDGKKFILFHKMSNYVGAVPLEFVKDWVKKKDPEFLFHLTKTGEDGVTYEDRLKDPGIRKVLYEQYGVAITV